MNTLSHGELGPPSLFTMAATAREMLEHAWSSETAYQGIVLRPEDRPSRGQCGVSSLWFSRYLQQNNTDARFTEGRIHVDNLDDEHVWVEARRAGKAPQVIDLTSDQYITINGALVHVGQYSSGPGTIGSYEPLRYFLPHEVPRRKLLARFAILEANIAKLPRRKRMKTYDTHGDWVV